MVPACLPTPPQVQYNYQGNQAISASQGQPKPSAPSRKSAPSDSKKRKVAEVASVCCIFVANFLKVKFSMPRLFIRSILLDTISLPIADSSGFFLNK